jgi:phosphopentomutase
LEAFDARLPEIQAALRSGDVIMITADHGNDPTTASTDHSRERVPLLITGQLIKAGSDFSTRPRFADLAATAAELLGLGWRGAGESFAVQIRQQA